MVEIVTGIILDKAIGFIIKYSFSEFKKLEKSEISPFQRELTAVIYKTIEDYKQLFPSQDKGGKFSFVKSSAILKNLLACCFIEEFSRERLINIINQEPNIYPPTNDQLSFFITRLDQKVSASTVLKDLYFNENYKAEIFNISENLKGLNEKLDDVTNSLQSLPQELLLKLNSEYHRQVEEIKEDLEDFQIKSALRRLENLERSMNSEVDQELLSKIIFFRALCTKELYPEKRIESAKLVIKAYKLNSGDINLKKNACVEYINLNDYAKAGQVATDLLEIEEYDPTGWAIKVISSSNLDQEIKNVPTIVKDSIGFNNSIAHFLIYKRQIQKIKELASYGVEIKIDVVSFPEFSIYTRQLWIRDLFLLYNEVIQSQHIQYITGNNIEVEKTPKLDLLLAKLKFYLEALKDTELKAQNYDFEFIYNYYLYRTRPSKGLVQKIDKLFFKTSITSLSLIQYAQILNHQERFEEALTILNKDHIQDLNSFETSMFKSTINMVLKNEEEAKKALLEFIELTPSIKYETYRNIEILVVNIFNNFTFDKEFGKIIFECLLKKNYENERLEEVTTLHALVKFSQNFNSTDYDIRESVDRLSQQKEYIQLVMDVNYITGEHIKNIEIFERLELGGEISEELVIFIHSLYSLLNSKDSPEIPDSSKKLLEALNFHRQSSKGIHVDLLRMEYYLVKSIQDWKKAKVIAEILYEADPKVELYQGFLAECFYHLDDLQELEKLSHKIPDLFEEEEIGILFSQILFTKNINEDKAFQIVFNLAQNKINTLARKEYFGLLTRNTGKFFKEYEILENGSYVEYRVNNKTFIEPVDKNHQWLGLKIGEKITNTNPLTHQLEEIEILKCFDERIKLIRNITEEANNPLNKLGIQAFTFTNNSPDEMREQIQKLFGPKEVSRDEFIQKTLIDYRDFKNDYASITASLFEEDYFDSYEYLTTHHQYNTIPSSINANLEEIQYYAIDFSTLFMFFKVDKQLGIQFPHKFIISPLIKKMIEEKIAKEKINPRASLKIHVTLSNIIPIKIPENYSEEVIKELVKIKEWIQKNCVEQHIDEKLDVVLKLNGEPKKDFFQLLVDSVFLGMRPYHVLVTNDHFHIKNFSGKTRIQSGELYLKKILPEDKLKQFYEYLLVQNYVGIAIPGTILKEIFIDSISKKNNLFSKALKSFSPAICPEVGKEEKIADFIKFLYLTTLGDKDKNLYAQLILSSSFIGSALPFRQHLRDLLVDYFRLLPPYDDIISDIFEKTEKIMFR